MIARLLMVFGGILAVAGFLGMGALILEPLYSTYNIIFKRKGDYVKYETEEGKNLLRRRKTALLGACLFLLVTGLLMFGGGWFLKYGPRGTDSLLSQAVESGTKIGDFEPEGQKEFVDASGNYVDENGKLHTDYVVIHESTVIYKDEFEGSAEEFVQYLKKISAGKLFIVDDYATSFAYHTVEKALEDAGMLDDQR